MPFKYRRDRNNCNAASMRRQRKYLAAVAAGHPKALAAEAQLEIAKYAMRPANELHKRIAAMPTVEERRTYRAEYEALVRRCQAVDRKAARQNYERLRAEVIEESVDIFN